MQISTSTDQLWDFIPLYPVRITSPCSQSHRHAMPLNHPPVMTANMTSTMIQLTMRMRKMMKMMMLLLMKIVGAFSQFKMDCIFTKAHTFCLPYTVVTVTLNGLYLHQTAHFLPTIYSGHRDSNSTCTAFTHNRFHTQTVHTMLFLTDPGISASPPITPLTSDQRTGTATLVRCWLYPPDLRNADLGNSETVDKPSYCCQVSHWISAKEGIPNSFRWEH